MGLGTVVVDVEEARLKLYPAPIIFALSAARLLDTFPLLVLLDSLSLAPTTRRSPMDHIKIMIYGFIGIGITVAVTAILTQILGIARN